MIDSRAAWGYSRPSALSPAPVTADRMSSGREPLVEGSPGGEPKLSPFGGDCGGRPPTSAFCEPFSGHSSASVAFCAPSSGHPAPASSAGAGGVVGSDTAGGPGVEGGSLAGNGMDPLLPPPRLRPDGPGPGEPVRGEEPLGATPVAASIGLAGCNASLGRSLVSSAASRVGVGGPGFRLPFVTPGRTRPGSSDGAASANTVSAANAPARAAGTSTCARGSRSGGRAPSGAWGMPRMTRPMRTATTREIAIQATSMRASHSSRTGASRTQPENGNLEAQRCGRRCGRVRR
jgi:hypothetical protein